MWKSDYTGSEIYKKTILKNRAFNASYTKTCRDIELSISLCTTVHDRKRLQMEGTAKKVRKMALNLYEI